MKLYNIICCSILLLLIPQVNAETGSLMRGAKSCFSGPFESHEKWLNLLGQKKKKFNREMFAKRFPKEKFDTLKNNLECKDFVYKVDGHLIEGYYLKPKKPGNKKLPVVIYNRGGNGPFGYVVFGKKLGLIAELAMNGFVVIGSQYRGGSAKRINNNGRDEFGGADVNDVIKLLDVAKEIPEADTSQVGMVGWSRGAMQSYIASQSMPALKTIVAIAGNSDAEKALQWRPQMEKVYHGRIPGFKENRQAELTQRSVSKWINKLPAKIPLLLIHGDLDKRVNVEQSKSLAMILEKEQHPHKLIIYPGDNHGLRKHHSELKTEVAAWLKKHLSS
ncbi:alpha/beta hydrolase family protein [Thalassomonas actiniarum]|uniref:S9 family peptidase n=1 Tax=Thalassomonas actiniarum TaxID=485447 RepID=A0AAF0C4D5_9GAMM|nr:prolyl oligopeptidase family serine peptidase [Thalassomonas actiniarum]WDE02187.1 S9 family peptidase [Thalassomonas actiniarum]